ncbi:MAG: DUF366 family protein [Vampirovibrio sp.]|nr:DUF366 family protein [Vampirovibrio sp.]
MKYNFIDDIIPYTGTQLASHWIYENYGILGDATVAFIGASDVPLQNMVDLEDVRNNDYIYSKNMLNFITEIFGMSLREGVVIQRLFSSVIQNRINSELGGDIIRRRGDDLFYKDTQKLSVSICTVSPTSVLIHTGLNIDGHGAPVEAAGLTSDLGIDKIKPLAMSCMRTLTDEWEDINRSCCKVKAVY